MVVALANMQKERDMMSGNGILSKSELKKRYLVGIGIYVLYQLTFFFVESLNLNYQVIHHPIDDLIPFNEFWMPAYLFWFPYLAFSLIYFAHQTRGRLYYQYLGLLFGGMFATLVIYLIWPNMVDLRPAAFPRDNLFTDLVRVLHVVDTPTNVCPSIHVYATLVAHLSLMRQTQLGKKRVYHLISLVFVILILASTVFLKQHSIVDLFWGVIMGLALYFLAKRFWFDETPHYECKANMDI